MLDEEELIVRVEERVEVIITDGAALPGSVKIIAYRKNTARRPTQSHSISIR